MPALTAEQIVAVARLSAEEMDVLSHLAAAWNVFSALPPPSFPDDKDDFRRAIHAAQHLVAFRVARRVNPEYWAWPCQH